MTTIGRSFTQLNSEIKKLNTELRTSQKEVSALDKELKFDSGNVSAVEAKFKTLGTQSDTLKNKIATLNEKQTKLNAEFEDGTISASSYKSQTEKTTAELAAMETQLSQVTTQLNTQNAAIKNAKLDSFNNSLTTLNTTATKVSRTLTAMVVALLAWVYTAIEAADEVADTAQKYNVAAESLQELNYAYEKTTGSADQYTSLLSSIASMQSTIAAGSGTKYLYYLEQLGIASDDLNDKSTAEIYEMIYEQLRLVTDATTQATIAYGLFGEAGYDLATIANLTTDELEALYTELWNTGIITDEQAKIAGDYADQLDILKNQLTSVALEIMTWWNNMSTAGQWLIAILLGIIIVLPTLISGIQAVIAVVKIAETSLSRTYLILTAIALVIAAITAVVSSLRGEVEKSTEELDELMSSLADTTASLSSEVSSSTESITTSNSTSYIDGSIDVNVSGDTAVDNATAETIGTTISDAVTAEMLNYQLGQIIK